MKEDLSFRVVLKKNFPEAIFKPNWLGIDINSSKIAVTIISKDKILKQTYFGKDVSTRQFRFEERRTKLQKYRDTVSKSKAGLKLKRFSRKQRNYVRTRMWQITNEIVRLAKEFNANIAIEKLRFKKHKGEWTKKSRRKVNRIPYGFFRHALKHIAEREGIVIQEVKPHYTSQTCPRCGYVSKANWKGYNYFKCVKCDYEADRDRTASRNIAERAGTVFRCSQAQFPLGNAPVNGHAWRGEGCGRRCLNRPELQAPFL